MFSDSDKLIVFIRDKETKKWDIWGSCTRKTVKEYLDRLTALQTYKDYYDGYLVCQATVNVNYEMYNILNKVEV